jgi:hypothetical protein
MSLVPNMGPIDRGLRLALGLLLIALSAAGVIGPWGYVGIVPLATALVRWCPLYRALGIDTLAHRLRR